MIRCQSLYCRHLNKTMSIQFPTYLKYSLALVSSVVLTLTIFTDSRFLKRNNKFKIPSVDELEPKEFNNVNRCYKSPDPHSSIEYFDDILNSEQQPLPGQAIFFHETTCTKTGIVQLNAKQACAIESAARLNPNRDIFVIFASPVGVRLNESLPQFYNKLQVYNNVYVRNMNLWRYSFDTPIFDWLRTNKLFESAYLFEHMSDIVRALTLYRYGGYHFDLDIIVQRNIDDLGNDFIGDDWATVVNGAVMHLNNYGIGREMSQRFFGEVIKNFNGASFIDNGPAMWTRILEDICSTENRTLWTRNRCHGFTIQSKETFYPISWSNYTLYFEPEKFEDTMQRIENATIIHVWNDRSKNIWNKVGINNAYQVVAERNCPLVYFDSDLF